jgi:RecJ-like exonuclease
MYMYIRFENFENLLQNSLKTFGRLQKHKNLAKMEDM